MTGVSHSVAMSVSLALLFHLSGVMSPYVKFKFMTTHRFVTLEREKKLILLSGRYDTSPS
jgi:hypothetical protein